ncbi:MAG TPA: septation protein SepH [Propionibacteriaceae bacterium]|nr:septation protein SepH [Propionibacteriaceae bacterium]
MRIARLVGLSQDGKSLIVATESGDELAVAVDERLRAALRGDRPRLGQLEIEMETSLSPRDIQARIRAGNSLEDVAKVAGLPLDRVERFAAPVLAEREHMARLAMASSVRRRGETSGHRSLRLAVTERLGTRGIDLETVAWDSYRLSDGRWTVTADYRSGEARRHATFTFDASGRFSVAEDDEARWLLGEHSAHPGPPPGRRPPVTGEASDEPDDTEPTLDLSDDLALVRAIREPPPVETHLAAVHELHPEAAADEDDLLNDLAYDERPENGATESASSTSAAGVTDATAVPDTSNLGWEPAIVVNYPVEPSLLEETDDADDVEPAAAVRTGEPGPPEPDLRAEEFGAAVPERADEHPVTGGAEAGDPLHPPVVHHHHLRGTDQPGTPDPPTGIEDRTDEAKEFAEETLAKESHTEELDKPAKKKRASVPSWDEIMFGGPRRG